MVQEILVYSAFFAAFLPQFTTLDRLPVPAFRTGSGLSQQLAHHFNQKHTASSNIW